MAHIENSDSSFHVPGLFFDTGDIVLSAKRDGITHLFKLHKSVLSVHSRFFSDTSVVKPPPTSGSSSDSDFESVDSHDEYYEGTPMMHLVDEPDDLTSLFKAFYSPSSLILERHNADSCVNILPLAILARKYQASGVTNTIVSQQWDALESEIEHKREDGGNARKVESWEWEDHVPEPAAALRLASVARITSILPAVFYQLSRTRAANEFDEWRFRDGSDHRYAPHRNYTHRTARWALLTRAEMLRFMLSKEALSQHILQLKETITKGIKFCPGSCGDVWRQAGPLVSADRHPGGVMQSAYATWRRDVCKVPRQAGNLIQFFDSVYTRNTEDTSTTGVTAIPSQGRQRSATGSQRRPHRPFRRPGMDQLDIQELAKLFLKGGEDALGNSPVQLASAATLTISELE
ncbi:hypothetical protein BS17DRAFT_833311 [Gyrodon lividus]|nr:hypothetical protein BS17DRAFT_833311 [Gyrodon lividus]